MNFNRPLKSHVTLTRALTGLGWILDGRYRVIPYRWIDTSYSLQAKASYHSQYSSPLIFILVVNICMYGIHYTLHVSLLNINIWQLVPSSSLSPHLGQPAHYYTPHTTLSTSNKKLYHAYIYLIIYFIFNTCKV